MLLMSGLVHSTVDAVFCHWTAVRKLSLFGIRYIMCICRLIERSAIAPSTDVEYSQCSNREHRKKVVLGLSQLNGHPAHIQQKGNFLGVPFQSRKQKVAVSRKVRHQAASQHAVVWWGMLSMFQSRKHEETGARQFAIERAADTQTDSRQKGNILDVPIENTESKRFPDVRNRAVSQHLVDRKGTFLMFQPRIQKVTGSRMFANERSANAQHNNQHLTPDRSTLIRTSDAISVGRFVMAFFRFLWHFRDAGDVAPLSQEGITSAGTSMTWKKLRER